MLSLVIQKLHFQFEEIFLHYIVHAIQHKVK